MISETKLRVLKTIAEQTRKGKLAVWVPMPPKTMFNTVKALVMDQLVVQNQKNAKLFRITASGLWMLDAANRPKPRPAVEHQGPAA